jgi:hypothetical protein
MAKGSAIHYSQEQLDFIKANCTLSRKDLTEKVNGVFGSEFSVDQIKSLCTRNKWKSGRTGCFEKGSKPWNTGTKGVCKPNSGNFKKGQISWNKNLLVTSVFVLKMDMFLSKQLSRMSLS